MLDLMRQRTDAVNRHDIPALTGLYSADCRVESPMAGGVVTGRQAVGKVFTALFEAFPDVRFDPDIVLVDGGVVAASGWLTGTYTGGFMGLPPSGNPIRLPIVSIATVVDGKIAAERRVYDLTGMLVQAGVLKTQSL